MRQYLSKKKDLYLFRRRVPDEIVHRVGKREIYRSLGTTSVRIARQRLLYLFHGTEMLFAMGRRPEVTEDELARAATYYLGWKGGFIEKIKAMPPAALSRLSTPNILQEEVDEEVEQNWISLGDTPDRKQAAERALLLERIDLFLRRTGFSDFEALDSDPQNLGLDPDRIVEAVNGSLDAVLPRDWKRLSARSRPPRAETMIQIFALLPDAATWPLQRQYQRSSNAGLVLVDPAE
jgi:hypothetical protein